MVRPRPRRRPFAEIALVERDVTVHWSSDALACFERRCNGASSADSPRDNSFGAAQRAHVDPPLESIQPARLLDRRHSSPQCGKAPRRLAPNAQSPAAMN